MTGIIDWAAARARMVVAFIVLSLTVGAAAYVGLPKEGEPDIDIPGLFVSVPFPGISAEDSERQLVRPMETEFQDLDGLKSINSTAAEGNAGSFIEFEFRRRNIRLPKPHAATDIITHQMRINDTL